MVLTNDSSLLEWSGTASRAITQLREKLSRRQGDLIALDKLHTQTAITSREEFDTVNKLIEEQLNIRNQRETHIKHVLILSQQHLKEGDKLETSVKSGQFKYFHLEWHRPGCGFRVALKPLFGDPDLYISCNHPQPIASNSTWKSEGDGGDSITILPSDSHFKLGTYFIGVRAGGGQDTDFQIWFHQKNDTSFAERSLNYTTTLHGKLIQKAHMLKEDPKKYHQLKQHVAEVLTSRREKLATLQARAGNISLQNKISVLLRSMRQHVRTNLYKKRNSKKHERLVFQWEWLMLVKIVKSILYLHKVLPTAYNSKAHVPSIILPEISAAARLLSDDTLGLGVIHRNVDKTKWLGAEMRISPTKNAWNVAPTARSVRDRLEHSPMPVIPALSMSFLRRQHDKAKTAQEHEVVNAEEVKVSPEQTHLEQDPEIILTIFPADDGSVIVRLALREVSHLSQALKQSDPLSVQMNLQDRIHYRDPRTTARQRRIRHWRRQWRIEQYEKIHEELNTARASTASQVSTRTINYWSSARGIRSTFANARDVPLKIQPRPYTRQ